MMKRVMAWRELTWFGLRGMFYDRYNGGEDLAVPPPCCREYRKFWEEMEKLIHRAQI